MENKRTPYGNLLPVSECDSLHRPTKFYPNWTISDRVMTLCSVSKVAAIPSQIYFRFPCLKFKKAQNYWHTKFRQDISIHGQDIPTSVSSKQTAAILNIYFQLQFWPFRCHRYVILHWPTKFYANWMIADGVMTSYWFYKMAAVASQMHFRFLTWTRLRFRKV